MKKLTLFIISLFFVSAVNLFAFSFDYLSSGEYAFYNDNRGGLDFLRGYLYVRTAQKECVFYSRNVRRSDDEVEVSRGVPNLSIPKSKAKKISLNGVDITVDESWEESDFEGNKSYFLKVFSIRDSQFMVEIIPDEMLNVVTWESLVRFMMLYNLTDYNSIVCERKKDFLQVSFALYDENGYKNYQYMIVPDKKDKILVNFSTFADIFDANKSYYQKILKSIKKSK